MNLLTVTRDMESPPGGWKYTVPETGLLITGPYAHILKRRVLNHMRANSLPIPDDAVLVDAICRESNHGAPFCGGALPEAPVGIPGMTWGQAKRFIATILEVAKDRKFVSKEEAERRAAICAGCVYSQNISGCKGCASAFRQAAKFIRGREIPLPKHQEFCAKCGCYLPLKSLIPNEVLNRAEQGSVEYPDHCWRLQPDEVST